MNTLFDKLSPYFNLSSRLLMAVIFVATGYGKIGSYAAMQSYMQAMGVPGKFLPLVIATEVIGGLMLLIGFQTRLVGFLLAGFTLLTALFFHHNLVDQMAAIAFMKNVAIVGGLLLFVQHGGGRFAIDNYWRNADAITAYPAR